MTADHRRHDVRLGAETKKNGRVTIRAMTYATFIKRAEKRLLGLRDSLRDAPFLEDLGLDPETYMRGDVPKQGELVLDRDPGI